MGFLQAAGFTKPTGIPCVYAAGSGLVEQKALGERYYLRNSLA
jgi:hypothetical protein